MGASILSQIANLQRLSVAELQGEWLRLYGEPTRSRNKNYLWKRLSWRVQELANGGLSDDARKRINELDAEGFIRARTPNVAAPAADPERRPARDPRLPSPGTVITKQYKGRELRVVVRDDGVEFDGTMYGSLTELTKVITGCKSINGKLFFGLTQRKRS